MSYFPGKWDKVVLFVVIVLLVVFFALTVKSAAQAPAPPLETKPLTEPGQREADSIHWKITKYQKEIDDRVNALALSEMKAQHVDVKDGWSLNLNFDRLERHPVVSPAPPAPAPEKPK
jgi:hypothetical protein